MWIRVIGINISNLVYRFILQSIVITPGERRKKQIENGGINENKNTVEKFAIFGQNLLFYSLSNEWNAFIK